MVCTASDPWHGLLDELVDRGVPARVIDDTRDRLATWGPSLITGLDEAYGPDSPVVDLLCPVLAAAIADRSEPLRDRDRAYLLEPDRMQRSDTIGYATYVDRFAGNLTGVGEHIDHLRSLGVTYLHLLPLLATRAGPDDGGYAVADYRTVRPDLGTMDDLAHLSARLHAAGISLTVDLVLNHVAREHPWAQAAREGDSRYRDYFYIFDDRRIPDEYERSLPEVFPDFAPGNFTHCAELDAWVWTTFNSWQWDINWTNPQVFAEYTDIMLNLANRGVDCLRLDAIAFIVKQMGTTCQNLPGVHVLTQALRDILRIIAPSVSLKAEAIVAPDDLVAYLGQGRFAGRVSDLAYHNSLMVQIWSALATQDARLMAVALDRFPPIPPTTQWATYLRCHDDIGWAIDDADAAAVGWSGAAHRAFLAAYYRGDFPDSPARGADFQDNPVTGDRRTSGSAASLTGVQAACETDSESAVDLAVNRLLLGYAMVFGFGGIPLIWMGDELALPDDETYLDEPLHADDNRWLHRPRMDWTLARRCEQPDPDDDDLQVRASSRTLHGMRTLARARASLPALHASTPTQVETPGDPEVVLFTRLSARGTLVEVYNVSPRTLHLSMSELAHRGITDVAPHDALGLHDPHVEGGDLILAPYAAHWLIPAADAEAIESPPTL